MDLNFPWYMGGFLLTFAIAMAIFIPMEVIQQNNTEYRYEMACAYYKLDFESHTKSPDLCYDSKTGIIYLPSVIESKYLYEIHHDH